MNLGVDMNTSTLLRKGGAVGPAVVLLGSGARPAAAARTWDAGAQIGVQVSAMATIVPVGGMVGVVAQANDIDHWVGGEEDVPHDGTDVDMLTSYVWSASDGGFPWGNIGPSVMWQAPTGSAGPVTITCTVNDMPMPILPPDGGSRDDAPCSDSVTVQVRAHTWDVGGGFSAQITQPSGGGKVRAGQTLTCTAAEVTDSDHWVVQGTTASGTAEDMVTYTWGANRGTFPGGNTGRSVTWQAPDTGGEVTITLTVDDGGQVFPPDDGTRDDQARQDTVGTTAWQITGLKVRRTGSGNAFAGSAQVAAGGKSGSEHKADVEIEVTPAISGVTVPAPTIVSPTGNGEVVNATVTGGGVTGADGKVVTVGAFTSSDIHRDVTLSIDPTPAPVTATVSQKWNNVNPWDQEDYWFFYDEACPVTVRLRFTDSGGQVPIQGHSVNFLMIDADVWHWNGDDYVKLTYTADPDVGIITTPGEPPMQLAAFTPLLGVADSGGGVYTSAFTVNWNIDEIVDSLRFRVQDDEVYRP